MSQIPIEKQVFGKDFTRVIDTEFKQLINNNNNIIDEINIDEFFVIYEQLFYQIPKEGDTNSHTYILNKTADYLGVKIQSDIDVNQLLQEITSLRQELLDANKQINELVK